MHLFWHALVSCQVRPYICLAQGSTAVSCVPAIVNSVRGPALSRAPGFSAR